VKEGSKPDPYGILSVGKTQHESATIEKTADPVFEETMHFLVRNPLTDTLLVKLMDRKTSLELGAFKQPLDAIYGRPEMRLRKQNFTLNTKSDAKVVMTLELKVLKLGAPAQGEMLTMDMDADTDTEEPSHVNQGGPSTSSQGQNGTKDPVKEPSNIIDDATAGSGVIEEPLIKSKEESQPLLSAMPKSGSISSSTAAEEDKSMKIRLTIRYSQTSQQLVVVVHSVANLPIEGDELPDPYVKLYVLPERNKKHKTEAQKDQCNPLYDEKFEFPIIDLRNKTLEVTVCDKKFIRRAPKLGEVLVALDDFQGGNTVTNWYPLIP